MGTLSDQLLQAEKRPGFVRDCEELLGREVRGKKGLGGVAIKGAYKTVCAIRPGFVHAVIDFLLDSWVAKLEPYYAEHLGAASGGSFGDLLSARPEAVAESLLEVTDARAEVTSHRSARKLYLRLRPGALKQVAVAVPGLGRLLDRRLS